MGIGYEKVLQLNRRRGVAIGFIGVGNQGQICIGYRIGIRYRLDIKERTPTGRTHLAKGFSNL